MEDERNVHDSAGSREVSSIARHSYILTFLQPSSYSNRCARADAPVPAVGLKVSTAITPVPALGVPALQPLVRFSIMAVHMRTRPLAAKVQGEPVVPLVSPPAVDPKDGFRILARA